MLDYLRDKLHCARLQARYQKLLQQQLLDLIQEDQQSPQPVADDPGHWQLLGKNSGKNNPNYQSDLLTEARQLVQNNPHARNLLRLMEVYVVGSGLRLTLQSRQPTANTKALIQQADRLWQEFLTRNQRHFSYTEYARRTWRDGECFLRKFVQPHWPPTVRFVDPETIASVAEAPDSQGILTHPDDVETPLAYLRVDPLTGRLAEDIPAEEMFHTRVGVDSNQKRGQSIFTPIMESLRNYQKWQETELAARKLQASIVLWRKVHGSATQATALADGLQSASSASALDGVRRERYRPGSIITTSQGTDLEFLQPKTNINDAVPLGRMLLLGIAAGAGLPEYMLTSDASNASYSSTMVAEGPAVKLFQSEQQFFTREFNHIWRWVMSVALLHGLLPDNVFQQIAPHWTFPQLVARDRNKERVTDARLVQQKVLSRAEVARRDDVDPAVMQNEIAAEQD